MSVAVERVPLSFLLAQNKDEQPPVEPILPFPAFRDEIPVIVTAVLERTAAFHALGDTHETGLLRLDRVLVDPRALEWKARVISDGRHKARWNGGGGRSDEMQEIVARSDARALEDQAAKRELDKRPVIRTVVTATKGQRVTPAIAKELRARGLRRCPKCGEDKPLEEFNTAGYCSCRFVNGKTSARSGPRKGSGGRPRVPVDHRTPAVSGELLPPDRGTDPPKVKTVTGTQARTAHTREGESGRSSRARKDGRPALTFDELLGDIKRLRAERDQLRDQLRSLYSKLTKALAE